MRNYLNYNYEPKIHKAQKLIILGVRGVVDKSSTKHVLVFFNGNKCLLSDFLVVHICFKIYLTFSKFYCLGLYFNYIMKVKFMGFVETLEKAVKMALKSPFPQRTANTIKPTISLLFPQ